MVLSPRERTVLAAVALFGFLGPNGVFVYYALFRWSELVAGLSHPVALAFVLEAGVVTMLIAACLACRPIGRWGWKTFVGLSLLGGLAFGIPVTILINASRRSG